jgi:FkbM family methyltransferase
MKTGLSKPILRAARVTPRLSKAALRLCSRALAPRKPPWIVSRIAGDLNLRLPVDTTLRNGMSIRVVWTDVIGYSICTDGYYDISSVRVLNKILKQGMTFVDVGTHVGQYTLVASDIVGPTGTVHSFEPQPDTFELLRHNVETNGLANVQLNRCALSETCVDTELYLASPDNVGQSSFRRPHNYSGNAITVQCRTLDDYVEEHGIAINVIKIDVEGAELSVLRGATKLLSGSAKPCLIIEFWEQFQQEYGSSCAEMASFLSTHGYTLFWITEAGLLPYARKNEEPRSATAINVLATPPGLVY